MTKADQKKVYHEEKTEDDVLRRMLATPPKPHKDSKLGGRQKKPS